MNRFAISGRIGVLTVVLAWMCLPGVTTATVESFQRGSPVRSALGQPAGPYREFVAEKQELRIFGPYIHSVTDTTVNLEWWLSDLARLAIGWRKSGDTVWQSVNRNSNKSGTFSLTGLEPDTRYEVRLKVRGSANAVFADLPQYAATDDGAAVLQFTTLATPPPADSYYVAPDGSDSNSGTSREEAWRTVSHAASRVVPGDTVWIAGGTYPESVRLRAAGEAGRPITFRSIPGERVMFDGVGRTLQFGFLAVDKPHQRIDGIYFRNYRNGSSQMPWRIDSRSNDNNGHIVVYESPDIQITRCFFDARGQGTGPSLAHIRDSGDVLIENCVVVNAMGTALEIYWNSPRVIVRNNVFLRNFIGQISPHASGSRFQSEDDSILIEKNIITDNLPIKMHVSLVATGRLVEYRDNIFYLRPERENIPTAANPLLIDPDFAWAVGRDKVDANGKPLLFFDRLPGYNNLDFPDLFATHPFAVEKGIGLIPEAFESFFPNQE